MGTLHAFSGLSEALERSRTRPLQLLRKMNRTFYDALKLEELDYDERRVFSKCLESVQFPDRIQDKDVIRALADPNRDFLKDYETSDWHLRRPWQTRIATAFSAEGRKKTLAIKRRLGMIYRLLHPEEPKK